MIDEVDGRTDGRQRIAEPQQTESLRPGDQYEVMEEQREGTSSEQGAEDVDASEDNIEEDRSDYSDSGYDEGGCLADTEERAAMQSVERVEVRVDVRVEVKYHEDEVN
ncbi:uncharacterized protein LAESUDRAFT_809032 [Laetiporus sulphureus 93-53]|uniref:Uncharacterized protein n=1 Tax=Laetiporus sulphureus 93-53 TaxID=1314785 RepID=A0A165HU66_9APHY|nr:uncharacterized protein LAESUDRAFT_809032 [Laetiporus sulphureus 93-53]KZT12191.1 hypothetical protein LAESUDRAFT_809032 [Laetiporus sulphureus 93-53]